MGETENERKNLKERKKVKYKEFRKKEIALAYFNFLARVTYW